MAEARVDRSAFAVLTFAEAERQDREYWWSRTSEERFEYLFQLMRLNYGDDALTTRSPRVLEITERRGR